MIGQCALDPRIDTPSLQIGLELRVNGLRLVDALEPIAQLLTFLGRELLYRRFDLLQRVKSRQSYMLSKFG